MSGRLTNRVRLRRYLADEMTQTELGKRVGVTRQTVAAIEAGKYSPNLETAFRMADALGVRLEQLFRWQPDR